jgi:hypothetical protein
MTSDELDRAINATKGGEDGPTKGVCICPECNGRGTIKKEKAS